MAATASQQFMSPQELANYLNVSLDTVYSWRWKGEGPRGFKVGRHVRYRIKDVDRWLEANSDPRPAA